MLQHNTTHIWCNRNWTQVPHRVRKKTDTRCYLYVINSSNNV